MRRIGVSRWAMKGGWMWVRKLGGELEPSTKVVPTTSVVVAAGIAPTTDALAVVAVDFGELAPAFATEVAIAGIWGVQKLLTR